MADNKTQPTDVPVADFLATVEPARRRDEGARLVEIFREVTGVEPVMWGPSIVGFGTWHYRYDSGREGDFMRCGFSPRKAKHSLYLMNVGDRRDALLARLGKHKTGASCLYVNKLDDIDLDVLRELIAASWAGGA